MTFKSNEIRTTLVANDVTVLLFEGIVTEMQTRAPLRCKNKRSDEVLSPVGLIDIQQYNFDSID